MLTLSFFFILQKQKEKAFFFLNINERCEYKKLKIFVAITAVTVVIDGGENGGDDDFVIG